MEVNLCTIARIDEAIAFLAGCGGWHFTGSSGS
jgi:hypothetical protein